LYTSSNNYHYQQSAAVPYNSAQTKLSTLSIISAYFSTFIASTYYGKYLAIQSVISKVERHQIVLSFFNSRTSKAVVFENY